MYTPKAARCTRIRAASSCSYDLAALGKTRPVACGNVWFADSWILGIETDDSKACFTLDAGLEEGILVSLGRRGQDSSTATRGFARSDADFADRGARRKAAS